MPNWLAAVTSLKLFLTNVMAKTFLMDTTIVSLLLLPLRGSKATKMFKDKNTDLI